MVKFIPFLRELRVAVVVAALAACSPSNHEASAPGGPGGTNAPQLAPPARRGIDAATARASHAKMVAALAEIVRQKGDNPFLGHKFFDDFVKKLAAMPPTAPLSERVQLIDVTAYEELKMGETRAAIERLQGGLALLENAGPRYLPERQVLLLHLGTAWLRLGENENCVHCMTGESCLLPIRGGGVHTKQEGSRHAIPVFLELLETAPHYAAARWLLNIAAMTVGDWPDKVPEKYRIAPEVFASEEPFPKFENIARRLGLDCIELSGGAIADDFDNDGLLDLVLCCWDFDGPMHIYRNNGDGTFTDRMKEAGLEGIVGGNNCLQADFNNDGFLDVLVLRGAAKEYGRHPASLLRNNGDGTFVDVAFAAGIAAPALPTESAAFADYDRDGDLDLYVARESSPDFPAPSQLYRNNGDETFTDVAEAAGVANHAYAKGVTWGDVDEDGWPDLFVASQGDPHRLYRNNHDGTFTDIAKLAGIAAPKMAVPTWFFDFDNDGHLDLWVSSYDPALWYDVAASWLGEPFKSDLPALYRGDGKGRFTNVAKEQGLTRLNLAMGCNFGDLDNDGFLDFYVGTGTPKYEALMPNVMFHNRRGKGFADVSSAGGFAHLQKGHGVAFADFDDDGDQDVFENMGGAVPGDKSPDAFYLNPGFGNHWLKIKLVGVRSNRCAIGARIHLEVEEDGVRRSIYKHVNSGSSFGADPLRQEIGVGKALRIARLEILWPATNETQTFQDVPVDLCIQVTEGADRYDVVELKRLKF
jgi:hypothetical protein